MGRKSKYSKEQKVQACEDYLNGKKTTRQIAVELNMSKNGSDIVLNWVKSYRANGHSIFDNKNTNNRYSRDFKDMVVKEYLQDLGSSCDLATKYESKGEDGLEDRRGKRKSREQLTDLEKAQQRIAELERINRRQEMELELLKKDEAFERTYLASLLKAKRIYLIRKQKIKNYSLIQSLHNNRNWPINEMC